MRSNTKSDCNFSNLIVWVLGVVFCEIAPCRVGKCDGPSPSMVRNYISKFPDI
jgi:hypothetical protein